MEISNLSLTTSSNITTYLYTGVSCLNNNNGIPHASVCICTNEDENNTVIELLDTELSTVQKAELHAIYRAISMIVEETNIVIVSRSEYAVKCITEWSTKWKEDNWKRTPKKSIDNISIIRNILDIIDEYRNKDKKIQIWHTSSIPNDQGNKIAQRLARQTLLQYI